MTTTASTITDLPPVTLAGTTFTVREQVIRWTEPDGSERTATDVHLTGPRGAQYFLRGFLNDDTGIRQVISWKSGAPLRKLGNEIRVIRIGDVLEQATTAAERRRLAAVSR